MEEGMINLATGYKLTDKVFSDIKYEDNHEISIEDALRIISFYGYNEEASTNTKIGRVCRCARDKIKKAIEQALVYNNYEMFDELVKYINDHKVRTVVFTNDGNFEEYDELDFVQYRNKVPVNLNIERM